MRVIVRGPVPVPGPEDIVVDRATAVALSASQQRMSVTGKLLGSAEMPGGAIFALDLASEPLAKRLLIDQASLGFPFHPRGCSLFSGPDGKRRLIVISDRTATEHVVEVFDLVGTAYNSVILEHVRTVADPEHLISPNDLVAFDSDRFYVTNDHGARQDFWRTLETGIALPWSTVVFWDGNRFHTVAREIEFANGIALDHARQRLYVAATRSKRIYRYPWDPADPAKELTNRDHIELPGCPDNLEWDEEGNLWAGADPSFLRLSIYALGITPTAPSLILRISFDAETGPRVEEVWHDETGEIISASSVAAVYGKGPVRRLLIGQPFGNHLLDCELRDGTSS
jgi:arylesterase / paraoxonase